ncbi:MAG: dipeptidase [Lachnospiraceae bacterium]|nr:dipeptidase [Lachnospiraceae bacterium]
MKVIDMHCDTISQIREKRMKGEPCGLRKNSLQVDLEKMREGDYLLQNFALFVDLKQESDPLAAALQLADVYESSMEENQDIIWPVTCFEDLEAARAENMLAGMMTLEEGGILCGDPAILREFYRLGVRMMTLTWNYENDLGFPNLVSDSNDSLGPDTERGLKEAGFAMLAEMERLGIIVDVSHLSDKGFYDVLAHTEKPFVASHSNARALCPHTRNLTDDMIRKIGERGGVIGLNYCPVFLDTNPVYTENESSTALIARHARYITDLGGMEVLGLGSDFDGISGKLEMDHCGKLPYLYEALLEEGFSEREIEGIFHGNVLRVYREILS